MLNSQLLAELFEKKDIQKAFDYQKIAYDTYQNIYGAKKIKELQKTISDDLIRKKDIEAKQIAKENKNKQLFLSGSLGVMFLIGFILYRNNLQRKKANNQLQIQKEKVENTLSQLKSTQAQLIQSEKMASLGELTAGIAHEIQNPLNFVNNFSELNKEMIDEASEENKKGNYDQVKNILNDLKENEEKINHHGKRAADIVKGMLQHSRTSSGQKEPTDINALCDEYVRLAHHALLAGRQGFRAIDPQDALHKDFNVTMKTDFDANIGKINIVAQDIGRVILNLINNAFYAVDEKKKQIGNDYEPIVTLSTKKNNNKIEIKIADNGNGIPQNIIDKIFQPFFTTKPTGQ